MAIFDTEKGGTSVSFTFSPGDDVHFSKELYADEFWKVEELTKNFVRYHYKRFYNGEISGGDAIKSNNLNRENDNLNAATQN